MKNDAIQIAKKFVSSIKTNGMPVTTAYLFGSYAKGNPHPGSDIDVCIVSPKLGKDFIDEYVKLSTVAGKIDDKIEPHPMSPADFAEKYNLLAHEIKTHGVSLTP